jgi:hypothetical protein
MADILDRVQKLLRLARNAGSEAEASLAAQRASELMAEHEIHEAQIALDDPDARRAPEAIDEEHNIGLGGKRRVAWKHRIINAVAATHGVEVYWSAIRDPHTPGQYEQSLALFGRLTAVQTASYVVQFLFAEVERFTVEHCDGVVKPPRGYRNSFRLGVATRIAERLREARETREATTPSPSAGVMVHVQKDREQVAEAFESYGKAHGFRETRAIGQYTAHGGAFRAGKRAGDRAEISSRARGGLPAGQHSLKKGGK